MKIIIKIKIKKIFINLIKNNKIIISFMKNKKKIIEILILLKKYFIFFNKKIFYNKYKYIGKILKIINLCNLFNGRQINKNS